MPIGKNSIKRVTNNGYTNSKNEAPDMQVSVVEEIEEAAPQKAAPKKKAPQKKAAEKVSFAKGKEPKATQEEKPQKQTEPENIKAEASEAYVNIGREMPIFLL